MLTELRSNLCSFARGSHQKVPQCLFANLKRNTEKKWSRFRRYVCHLSPALRESRLELDLTTSRVRYIKAKDSNQIFQRDGGTDGTSVKKERSEVFCIFMC